MVAFLPSPRVLAGALTILKDVEHSGFLDGDSSIENTRCTLEEGVAIRTHLKIDFYRKRSVRIIRIERALLPLLEQELCEGLLFGMVR